MTDAAPRKRTLVVAGLIVNAGRVLIAQRGPVQKQPELALKWEFPGGKVEPGEAPVAALVRELREELAVDVEVGPIWDVLFHAYPAFDLVMLVYACRIVAGEPRPVEVARPRLGAGGRARPLGHPRRRPPPRRAIADRRATLTSLAGGSRN